MEKPNFNNDWVPTQGNFISISQVLEMIQEPFDAMGIIDKNYDKWQSNPDSPYYGKSKDEIQQMWKAKGAISTEYGRKLDSYIGECLCGDEVSRELWELDNDRENDTRLNAHCHAFDTFRQDFIHDDIEYVDRERDVYYDMGNGIIVRGRFDCLFYNKSKDYWIIIDWKSSGSIETIPNMWTKKLLGPASSLYALNHYTYTLQTHFYKRAMLKHYLPEGTDPSKVYTLIIDLPGEPKEECPYTLCKEAFPYDDALLDKIFEFAVKKRNLLKKRTNV